MKRRTLLQSIPAVALLSPAVWAARIANSNNSGETSEGAGGVFELRVYHAVPGRLGDLLARFRDHTTKLFERHGLENVAYWTPTDDPLKGKTLIYILKHPSREAAAANWKAFGEDPEWKKVAAKSEENGKIVEKVESTFMVATDFSPTVG